MLLIVSLPGSYLFIHARSGQNVSPKSGVRTEPLTPDGKAIAAVRATATANANIILFDPLDQNIHNWPVSGNGPILYVFKNRAYHITNNDSKQSAPAFLGGVNIKKPFIYSLTMEEIRGDDSSINNSFGMIFCFSSQTRGKSTVVTFYAFQVVNSSGSEYRFAKYDDSKGPSVDPWSTIWHHPFGSEFHQGQGPKYINTFKVVVNAQTFTFIVNGKKVGAVQDGSLTSGEVGMLVNQKGTEVAFSNLELTYS